MIKLEEKIRRELLNCFPVDLHTYAQSNEKIIELKNQMEQLGHQLLAAAKAGSLGDFYENEAPLLRSQLFIKKLELDALVEIERKKKISKTKPSPFFAKLKIASDSQKKEVMTENLSFISDFNIYIAVFTIILLFGFQFFYSSSLENRIRNHVEVSIVRPAEDRVKLIEVQNAELIQKVNLLQKQVHYLSRSKRAPVKIASRPKVINLVYNKAVVKKISSNRYSRN